MSDAYERFQDAVHVVEAGHDGAQEYQGHRVKKGKPAVQPSAINPVLWIRNKIFRIRTRLFRKFRIRIRIQFRIQPNLSVKRQNQNFKLKLQH